MNKDELVTAVAAKLDIPKTQALGAVNAVFDEIFEALEVHDAVNVPGFGKFVPKHCASRQSRNPQTGEAIEVPQHFVVRFSPAKALKDAVR